MKTAMNYQRTRTHVPYPNAVTRRQIANKVLDLLIMAASGAGLAASLLFILLFIRAKIRLPDNPAGGNLSLLYLNYTCTATIIATASGI